MGHSGIMCNFLSKHCATMLFCNTLALNRRCALELHLKLLNMKQQPKWATARNMNNRIFVFFPSCQCSSN